MNLLVRSVMLGIKHAAPVMKAQGSDSIVSTSSVAGLIPGSTATAYGVAKAAVLYLTNARRSSWRRIASGSTASAPASSRRRSSRAPLPTQAVGRMLEDLTPALEQFQPLRWAGRPDDIAEGVLNLADERAGFVTGVALPIDGGFAAGIRPGESEALWAPLRSIVAAAGESIG